MAVSGQLIQDAVDRLLPPPDAAPLCSLSDMDEDEADSGSQTDTSNEQERVERTLAASSQLIQDALDRLQAAPDAAPRQAYPDMDEDEATDEGENKPSDSDSEGPGGHEGDNSQGDVATSDSDPEEWNCSYSSDESSEASDTQGPSRLLTQAARALQPREQHMWEDERWETDPSSPPEPPRVRLPAPLPPSSDPDAMELDCGNCKAIPGKTTCMNCGGVMKPVPDIPGKKPRPRTPASAPFPPQSPSSPYLDSSFTSSSSSSLRNASA
jgi:hypothetical protein